MRSTGLFCESELCPPPPPPAPAPPSALSFCHISRNPLRMPPSHTPCAQRPRLPRLTRDDSPPDFSLFFHIVSRHFFLTLPSLSLSHALTLSGRCVLTGRPPLTFQLGLIIRKCTGSHCSHLRKMVCVCVSSEQILLTYFFFFFFYVAFSGSQQPKGPFSKYLLYSVLLLI